MRKPKKPNLTVCFRPKEAWYSKELNKNNKRPLVFSADKALFPDQPIRIRCRTCFGCRMQRSLQWAIRCNYEAKEHDSNCFLTLTYDDEHLPDHGTLVKADHQSFLKRLRKAIHPAKVRYFLCGEYGERRGRPHYHVCLFGYDFPDKVAEKLTRNGDVLYVSDTLTDLWGKGNAWIGELTFQSAAYTARYILKKSLGTEAREVDPDTGLYPYEVRTPTGDVVGIQPEYVAMSLKPGIGAEWFERFGSECFPSSTVVHEGREFGAPDYFLRLLEKHDPEFFAEVQEKRRAYAQDKSNHPDSSSDRLQTREKIALAYSSKARKREGDTT